jgi:hypothetical protein
MRILISIIIGLLLGVVAGLYLGWELFPPEFKNSPINDLTKQYQDEYTVLIASGYMADNDAQGAIERLRVLGIENAPAHVQELTEQYITNSGDLQNIRYLVNLSTGLGRFTPIMEPYRRTNLPTGAGS